MNIKYYIQLSRPTNFVFVVLAFFLTGFFFSPASPIINCFILALSTGFILGAGNVVNDIVDVEIDKINRQDRVLVKELISIKNAYWFIGILLIMAALGYAYLQSVVLFSIGGYSVFMLFVYNRRLKRQVLIGNFTIALLLALSIIQVLFLPYFKPLVGKTNVTAITIISVLVFLMNLIREIIKDIEDMEGDRVMELDTLPIKFGLKATRVFVWLLYITFLAFTAMIISKGGSYEIYGFLLLMPLLYFSFVFWKASKKSDYSKLSVLLKVIMAFGLASSFLLVE